MCLACSRAAEEGSNADFNGVLRPATGNHRGVVIEELFNDILDEFQ